MTPPAIPGRPAERLEQLAALEAGARIRYAGRAATVLGALATSTPLAGVDLVELEVLFDDRSAPEVTIASAENLDAFELLPPPRVYDPKEAPRMSTRPARQNPIDRFGDKRPAPLDPRDETITVGIRLPARYVRELDRLAADVETTRSAWARHALLEAIDPFGQLTQRDDEDLEPA